MSIYWGSFLKSSDRVKDFVLKKGSMMMNLVIDKLVEVLSAPSEPVLSSSRLGVKKPSSESQVPAIVISLSLENYKGNGIGRFIRAGDTLIQNTQVVEVTRASPKKFSSDLRVFNIWPLPLKKNPASVEKKFTEKDVQIRNVTDPARPLDYWLVAQPTRKEEYKLDLSKAQVIFGKAQNEGEKLEVIHWTLTWRDEILADRYSGSMILEIWANSFDEADGISRQLQNSMKLNRAALRQKGFLKLQPASLAPVENVLENSPLGSSFSVWKQQLGYRFEFEAEEGGELSSGKPIRQVNVDIRDHLVESLSIPSSSEGTSGSVEK